VNVRWKASITWGISVAAVVVLGVFLVALVTSSSTSIPGVVEVSVRDTGDKASVGLGIKPGVLLLALGLVAVAAVLTALLDRGSREAPP